MRYFFIFCFEENFEWLVDSNSDIIIDNSTRNGIWKFILVESRELGVRFVLQGNK